MSRMIAVVLLALFPILAAPLAAQLTDPETEQPVVEEEPSLIEFPGLGEEEDLEDPGTKRVTIVPWSIQVLGKNYESFPNDEASIVLSDWLVNSLINLKVFNVVNRDKIQTVLSEQQLVASGYAEDASASALADAGKLLKVNYILFGNFKNLGKTSEVDFKLLSVDTTTYSHAINFTIPFNPSIEKMKPEIDRIVAALATHFPVVAVIREILDDRRLVLDAGTESGISDAMEAELWQLGDSAPAARGFVIRATPTEAEVELDRPMSQLNLFDYEAKIKIVPPAQAALTKGLRDLEQGRYREATTAFQKGLEADPDDGLLHANYARACWRSGDYGPAVDAFRRALNLRPDDIELLEDAAAAMLEAGHIEELIEILQRDQRMAYSQDLVLHFGQAQEALGYPERARDAYRAALKKAPDHAQTHFRLAVLAAKRGELEEAEREFRLARTGDGQSLEMEVGIEASQITPASSTAEKMTLATLLNRAKEEGDFAALTSASEILLVHQPLWGLSLELAQKSLELNPNYLRATIAAARAYAAGGQRSEAVNLLNKALRDYPNSVALLLLSGELLTAESNFIEAESRFRQAQDLARDDWRPSEALGEIYTRQGDHLKAVRAYLDTLERAEAASAPGLTVYLHKLGKAAVLAKQHETARPYLERCVAAAPDDQECQYYLGLCYFQRDAPEDHEKAIASFKAAAEIGDSYYYLGALYDRLDDLDNALSWHRRCITTGCAAAEQSQRRIDLLESITGTVTRVQDKAKMATLDVGRIHGVTHGLEGAVVTRSALVGQVRVEQVQDRTSVAIIVKGEPLVGQTVRFRPTRPKGLSAQESPKKGVVVRWRTNPEPEVDYYEVQRGSSPRGPWKLSKKVKHPTHELHDRSAKPGGTHYYKVVAVSDFKTRSMASEVVEIALR